MAILTFEDLEGFTEAVLFPQVLERAGIVASVDAVLRLKAKIENSDRGVKLIVHEVQPFDGAAFAPPPSTVVVRASEDVLQNGRADRLRRIVEMYPGRDALLLEVCCNGVTKTFQMPAGIDAGASGLHAELIELFGAAAISER